MMETDTVYNVNNSRGYPFPPLLPKTSSELYQRVKRSNEFPPILQRSSRAVPYKEIRHHRTSAESIANNYRPRAQDLKISQIRRRPQTACQSSAKPARLSTAQPRKTVALRRSAVSPRSPVSIGARNALVPVSSRPLSPTEQLDIMRSQEERRRISQGEPTQRDLERYLYYINIGVPNSAVVPPPHQLMNNIMHRLPLDPRSTGERIRIMMANMEEELKRDHYFSLKKSTVDYILLDPSERRRLSISSIPTPSPGRVVRAPVPWAATYREAKMWQSKHLFTTNGMMLLLQDVWLESFCSLRFVRLKDLSSASLPLSPFSFEDFVRGQCRTTRDQLLQRWLPRCASLFQTFKDLWLPIIPRCEQGASLCLQEFFGCVAALMSQQLRNMVTESLRDLLCFLAEHEEGNDFAETFDELEYVRPPLLLMTLQVEEPRITFSPSFQECWELVHGAFMEIIKSAEKLPRVECSLFPDVKNLYLHTVRPDEALVADVVSKAKDIFYKNTVRPEKYLHVYKKYTNLLDNTAKQDITEFLNVKHSLRGFTKKIQGINALWREIASQRVTAPLALFCLDAGGLNEDLCGRARRLKDMITSFEAQENRELNKRICQKYKEISETSRASPETTEKLVSLTEFISHSSDVTVHKLLDEIDDAAQRLGFLLDHAALPPEDLRLNSQVFHWPDHILVELEDGRARLAAMREQTEDQLQTRMENLAERLEVADKQIQAFTKKDVISAEEVKKNVEHLGQITADLEAAVRELEDINKEQTLLEHDPTEFPKLEALMADKRPYERLWITALDFQSGSEAWMNGPLLQLDVAKISDELDAMLTTVHELSALFYDLPGPSRVAKTFKGKIEKFKHHLPILKILRSPDMRERHWEKMSGVVGFDVRPDVSSSLVNMLERGLSKFSEKLEEVAEAAREEYSLEKSMEKMKTDWAELRFSFAPYKDTGANVVSEVDAILELLENHIEETQAWRGSPFITPIESESKVLEKVLDVLKKVGSGGSLGVLEKVLQQWEEQLLSTRDVIDAMWRCQTAWLYLEPIFRSDAAAARMPEEARKFEAVDSCWRSISGEAVKDTRVLVATGRPDTLQRLQECSDLIDDIQRGLKTHLGEKTAPASTF